MAKVVSARAQNKERAELCAASGLQVQAKLADGILMEVDRFYHNLSLYESEIWSRFLPEIYRKSRGHWLDFRYGVVPRTVVDEIAFADSLQLFDDFEIWTPEGKYKDPVVMGVVVERGLRGSVLYHRYLITRWGESLKPFNEIEEDVLKDHLRFHDSSKDAPPEVLAYLREAQKRYPRHRIHLFGKTWNPFRRHCRSRTYRVEIAETRAYVCCKCGHVKTQLR